MIGSWKGDDLNLLIFPDRLELNTEQTYRTNPYIRLYRNRISLDKYQNVPPLPGSKEPGTHMKTRQP